MSAASFEGFLSSVTSTPRGLVVRFLEGGFDPAPTNAPAFVVTLEEVREAEAAEAELRRIAASDEGVYVWLVAGNELHVQSDHDEELTVVASRVSAVAAGFEFQDYERLAKLNHEWGCSQTQALDVQTKRLQVVQNLLREQHARTEVKLVGHAVGTTARTLYEQHLHFLARLLRETEAS